MSDETKFNLRALAGHSAEELERIREEQWKKDENEKRLVRRANRIQQIAMNVPKEKLAERVSWLLLALHEARGLINTLEKLADTQRDGALILTTERDSARKLAQKFGEAFVQHKMARKNATDAKHNSHRELRESAKGLWETWQEYPDLYADKNTFDEEVSTRLHLKKDTIRKWREGWQKSAV